MLPSDFIQETEISDLPSEQLSCLAEQIGVSNVMKLWDKLRGRSVAFPANWPNKLIAKWLKKQPDLNISDAAWQLGVSSRTISKIANKVPAKKNIEQPNLFSVAV